MMEVMAGAWADGREEDLRSMLLRFHLLPFDAAAEFEAAARIYRICRRAQVASVASSGATRSPKPLACDARAPRSSSATEGTTQGICGSPRSLADERADGWVRRDPRSKFGDGEGRTPTRRRCDRLHRGSRRPWPASSHLATTGSPSSASVGTQTSGHSAVSKRSTSIDLLEGSSSTRSPGTSPWAGGSQRCRDAAQA